MGLFDLFKQKWKHNDPEIRKEAVKKLDDQNALNEVATTDSEKSIRKIAIEKLKDQSVLSQIAIADADPNNRQAAIKSISDNNILFGIFEKTSDNNLKENLENYVNGLIAANAVKGFDPKAITKAVYDSIETETGDIPKALGIAYHVPSMVARLIDQNPKFGTIKFTRLGYNAPELADFIDNLTESENKLAAIAGYIGIQFESFDEIEERVNNAPADAASVG